MKHKRKHPGKPAGMNYADVLRTSAGWIFDITGNSGLIRRLSFGD